MGLEGGISAAGLLRWAYAVMKEDPAFSYVEYDEATEQLYFTVRGERWVERRYRLTIERSRPVVVQVEGPPEER